MRTSLGPVVAALSLVSVTACLLPLDEGEGPGGLVPGSENVTVATTWAATPAPCDAVVKGTLRVKAALTVAPGATVCFEPGAGMLVEETGSLNADGTAEAPISFVGTVPTAGSWKGISITSVNAANVFRHAVFAHAGNPDSLCCGFFLGGEDLQAALLLGDNGTGAQVTVEDTVFRDIAAHGLFMFPKARFASFARNTFQGVAKAPVTLSLDSASALDAATQYAGPGNGQPVIRVLATTVQSAVTLKGLPVPYAMSLGAADKTFLVGAALVVEAGARLEFEANCGMIVEETGSLVATGTPDRRVVFTGRSEVQGSWKGLALTGLDNALSNVDIRFGGNADPLCCGFFEGGSNAVGNLLVGATSTAARVTLTDVTSTQSGGRGVAVMGGSTVTLAGSNDLSTGNALPNSGL
ncbi:MAG: hypothetical protein RL653_3578 [Pseudomonadota bacterium]|jgi:hypothetical protein